MSQLKTKEYKHYFDYLRVLASLMVIMIHTTALPYSSYMTSVVGANVPFFSHLNLVTLLDTSVRSAVPIFFMISGALLLNSSYNFNFFKNFLRLAFPLAIWSILGALLVNYYLPSFNFKEALLILPFHTKWPHNGHFWYIYTLCGIYFVMPILKKMISNLEQKDYKHLLFIWLVFSVLSPSISYYIKFLNLNKYNVVFLAYYLGFLFLGYYIDRYTANKIFTPNKIFFYIGLMIIALLAPWLLTWQHNLHATKFVSIYLGHFNVFVITQSVLFFMLAKYFLNRPISIITLLSKLSFTAYCCHILVINFLFWSPLFKTTLTYFQTINPTAEVLFKFVFVGFFSYLIAYLLSLLPRKISYYFGV